MATVTRFITYKIPEKSDYTSLLIYSSTTESGTYTLDDTLAYSYPTRATEYASLDTTKWYKIRFANSTEYSPYSVPFFGGSYDDREQFAAITTTFDGAGFASVSGFYSVTNLSTAQVEVADAAEALGTARAYIDLVTDDNSPYRFRRDWGNDITRRKYNASIEITKKAEIYFAASLVYQDIADDKMMISISGNLIPITTPVDLLVGDISPSGFLVAPSTSKNISVGQTSIQDKTVQDQVEIARFNLEKTLQLQKYNNEKNLAFASFLDGRQADKILKEANFLYQVARTYASKADALIDLIKPSTIQIRYGETKTRQFMNIGDIWSFANSSSGSSDPVFTENIAELTGLGSSLHTLYSLNSVTVNGTASQSVVPMQSATLMLNSSLIINGVTYFLDSWTDSTGIKVGKAGTSNGTAGYSLDVASTYAKIIWNNTAANGGFDLVAGDNITLTYWVA